MQFHLFSDVGFAHDVILDDEFGDQEELGRRTVAAEHFVLYNLLWVRKVAAFRVPDQRPYDLIVEPGRRVQVKSRGWAVNGRYPFGCVANANCARRAISRGQSNGASTRGLLSYKDKIDAFAFVAMDINRILYFPVGEINSTQVSFSKIDFQGKDDLSWNHLLYVWNRQNGAAS